MRLKCGFQIATKDGDGTSEEAEIEWNVFLCCITLGAAEIERKDEPVIEEEKGRERGGKKDNRQNE